MRPVATPKGAWDAQQATTKQNDWHQNTRDTSANQWAPVEKIQQSDSSRTSWPVGGKAHWGTKTGRLMFFSQVWHSRSLPSKKAGCCRSFSPALGSGSRNTALFQLPLGWVWMEESEITSNTSLCPSRILQILSGSLERRASWSRGILSPEFIKSMMGIIKSMGSPPLNLIPLPNFNIFASWGGGEWTLISKIFPQSHPQSSFSRNEISL